MKTATTALRSLLACALLLKFCVGTEACAGGPGAQDARIVTTDVELFMKAMDIAGHESTREARIRVFEREYFERGTPALRTFLQHKKILSAGHMVDAVERRPRFYASLTHAKAAMLAALPELNAAYRRLRELYPEAEFPPITVVVGHGRSGGTVTAAGPIIALESFAVADGVVLDEVRPEHLQYVRPMREGLTGAVHEMVHTLQSGIFQDRNLLKGALAEGGAEFLANLVMPSPPADFMKWGEVHEAQVWARFRNEMHGVDESDWIANNDRATADWPAPLGYFVGYRIAQALYERAADKKAAVRTLLELRDPDAILAASGYAERFGDRAMPR